MSLAETDRFASIIGKSTLEINSIEYTYIQEATHELLERGYGIIHGGYAGGSMQAANDTAYKFLKRIHWPMERNIGVPQKQHDCLWPRVDGALFTEPAEDIYDRLRWVLVGNIIIVGPVGGDGTELEQTAIFHENIIQGSLAGGIIKPLIFLQTKTGTQWESHIQNKLNILSANIKDSRALSWLYFSHTMNDFKTILNSLDGTC